MPIKKKHPPAKTSESKETDTSEKTAESTDNPPQNPLASGGIRIIGLQQEGKNPTRLYQTSPDTKEWLTKEQARDSGFYWAD